MNHQPTQTAQELRTMAASRTESARESFERCDTDGFLTQGCSAIMASLYLMQADLLDQDGKHEFPALFDLEGNLVAAKVVQTQYGTKWGILASDNPFSRVVKYVAYKPKRQTTLEKHGYREGRVRTLAYADLAGSHVSTVRPCIFRDDNGFSRDVEVVSNGR